LYCPVPSPPPRWFPSILGATSESFADAAERFCSNPTEALLLSDATAAFPAAAAAAQEAAAAAAAAADKAASAAAAAGKGDAKKEAKKEAKRLVKQQQELLQDLANKQMALQESKMAQMAAEGKLCMMCDCWHHGSLKSVIVMTVINCSKGL
jgi:flagellar biosynthesis/type III secretory pathway protein FliH